MFNEEESSATFFGFIIVISALIFELGVSEIMAESSNLEKIFPIITLLSGISILIGLIGFVLSRKFLSDWTNKFAWFIVMAILILTLILFLIFVLIPFLLLLWGVISPILFGVIILVGLLVIILAGLLGFVLSRDTTFTFKGLCKTIYDKTDWGHDYQRQVIVTDCKAVICLLIFISVALVLWMTSFNIGMESITRIYENLAIVRAFCIIVILICLILRFLGLWSQR